MASGIYSITNTKNHKQYIGSAVYIVHRWGSHRYYLRTNKHANKHLQAAWNKYGEDAFEFSVLELCEIPQLLAREQSYFDREHPEYNKAPVAGSQLGYKFDIAVIARMSAVRRGKYKGAASWNYGRKASAEARLKMSLAKRGKRTGKYNPISKPVICLTTGDQFETGCTAAQWVRAQGHPKACNTGISQACCGRIKSYHSFRFSFANDLTASPD